MPKADRSNAQLVGRGGGYTIGGDDLITPLPIEGQYWSKATDEITTGAALEVDWDDGNCQLFTLGANTAVTFINPGAGGRYLLRFDTGAGGFTPTFPATVKWLAATPTIVTTASKKWVMGLFWDGAHYLASYAEEA